MAEHDLWPMEYRAVPSEEDQPSTRIADTDAVDEEPQYFAITSTDSIPSGGTNDDTANGNEELPLSVDVVDPLEQLDSSLLYLRDTYRYCLFCGCQYEDQNDMMTSCPGINEEDHE